MAVCFDTRASEVFRMPEFSRINDEEDRFVIKNTFLTVNPPAMPELARWKSSPADYHIPTPVAESEVDASSECEEECEELVEQTPLHFASSSYAPSFAMRPFAPPMPPVPEMPMVNSRQDSSVASGMPMPNMERQVAPMNLPMPNMPNMQSMQNTQSMQNMGWMGVPMPNMSMPNMPMMNMPMPNMGFPQMNGYGMNMNAPMGMPSGPQGFGMVDSMPSSNQEEEPRRRRRGGKNKPRLEPSVQKRGDSSRLFVGGIAPFTNSDALREYFGQYGPISDAMVVIDKETGRGKGFGFVQFAGELPRGLVEVKHVIDNRSCNVREYKYTAKSR